MLIFVALLAFGVSTGLHASEQTKTLPGFTVFDKDGEYLKFIGPMYGDLKVKGFMPPFSLTSIITVNATAIPTVNILFLFLNGTIFFEGMPINYFDGDADLCLSRWMRCPYLESKRISDGVTVKLMETGLVPGWYDGTLDASTLINGKRLRLARMTFKIKLRETS